MVRVTGALNQGQEEKKGGLCRLLGKAGPFQCSNLILRELPSYRSCVCAQTMKPVDHTTPPVINLTCKMSSKQVTFADIFMAFSGQRPCALIRHLALVMAYYQVKVKINIKPPTTNPWLHSENPWPLSPWSPISSSSRRQCSEPGK